MRSVSLFMIVSSTHEHFADIDILTRMFCETRGGMAGIITISDTTPPPAPYTGLIVLAACRPTYTLQLYTGKVVESVVPASDQTENLQTQYKDTMRFRGYWYFDAKKKISKLLSFVRSVLLKYTRRSVSRAPEMQLAAKLTVC